MNEFETIKVNSVDDIIHFIRSQEFELRKEGYRVNDIRVSIPPLVLELVRVNANNYLNKDFANSTNIFNIKCVEGYNNQVCVFSIKDNPSVLRKVAKFCVNDNSLEQ